MTAEIQSISPPSSNMDLIFTVSKRKQLNLESSFMDLTAHGYKAITIQDHNKRKNAIMTLPSKIQTQSSGQRRIFIKSKLYVEDHLQRSRNMKELEITFIRYKLLHLWVPSTNILHVCHLFVFYLFSFALVFNTKF